MSADDFLCPQKLYFQSLKIKSIKITKYIYLYVLSERKKKCKALSHTAVITYQNSIQLIFEFFKIIGYNIML